MEFGDKTDLEHLVDLLSRAQQLLPLDFSGGPVLKNSPANAGDTGLISGLGRSHKPQSNEACAPRPLKCAHPGAAAPQQGKPPQ